MGFILILEDDEIKKDEFKEFLPFRSPRIDSDKAYVSITKQCRKGNDHNFRYSFSVGKDLAITCGIKTPSQISFAFSDDGKRIRMRQCADGKWKFCFNNLSPHSRTNIVLPSTPFGKQMKTTPVEVEKAEGGELILNIEKAVQTYGY